MTVKFFSGGLFRSFVHVCLAILICLAGSEKLFSQPAPVTYRTANRWLIIVETSRAMQPRAAVAAQIAGNLMLSGMNGQLRPGDSVGLWTFNSSLRAGEFALQTWTPENSKAIAENVALFVTHQKFEGRPGRNVVFPAMNQVISNSDFITAVMITGGGETVNGTPFDKAINAIHQRWQAQQEKARQPFLTMFRAQHGRITDFEVGRPPAPLEFPPLPLELLITNPVVVAPPPPPVVITPPSIAPNLIVHGKKPEPVAETISNPPPAIVTPTNIPVLTLKTDSPSASVISNATVATTRVTNRENVAASSRSSTNPVIATVATEESSKTKTVWFAALIAVAAAAGLMGIWIRRSRTQTRVSLITQSLERDKK